MEYIIKLSAKKCYQCSCTYKIPY